MDDRRFDAITKALAKAGTRRRLLRSLVGTALGGLLARAGPIAAADRRRNGGGEQPRPDNRRPVGAAQDGEGGELAAPNRGGGRCSRLNQKCGKDAKCCNGQSLACKGKRCRCKAGTVPQGGSCVPVPAACPSGQKRCADGRCVVQNLCCEDDECPGELECQDDNRCRCPSGQKQCGATVCIPVNQCCGGCSGGKTCQNGTCRCPTGQADIAGTCRRTCQTGGGGNACGSAQCVCNPTVEGATVCLDLDSISCNNQPCTGSADCGSNEVCRNLFCSGADRPFCVRLC